MRRLFLTSGTALLALLLLAPPAWAEWVWPLRGEVITPYRNGSDPYASGQHRGIDIAGPSGATVVAATSGEVRFAGTAGSSGLTVSVRTADGRYDTSYLHLSSTAVREGDHVAAGQRVGTVGTTGTRSVTEPHLHFGVRDAGSRHAYHDPLTFLPPPSTTSPPRGAPAPQPAPVPVGPAPAPLPVHAPAPARIPVGSPAPRPLPVAHRGAPRRVPSGAPRRVPGGVPRQLPAGAPRRIPAGEAQRVPAGQTHGFPAGEPAPASAGAPDRLAAREPDGPRAREPRPAGAFGPLAAGHPHQDVAHGHTSGVLSGNDALHAATGPPANETGHRSALPTTDPRRGDTHAGEPSSSGPDVGLLAACLGLLAAAAVLGLTPDGRKATSGTRHRLARVLQPMFGRR